MWKKSNKLDHVGYDIRGIVLDRALELEERGIEILKLNIGNTAPFGLFPDTNIYEYSFKHMESTFGYGDSRGIFPARESVQSYYLSKNITIPLDSIYIGNGVSELIPMALNALINIGDEILLPTPDYPLWTASARLAGANVIHYVCDEENSWLPDINDIKKKISSKTRAITIINPNNPTGAVYSKEILKEIVSIARENKLLIFADEIYERVLFDDAKMYYMAQITEDHPCIFFNGLSKAFRAPGLRMGWMCIHDPKNKLKGYKEGIHILSNMRLCSNILSQWAIVIALSEDNEIDRLVAPTGRLYKQRQIVMDIIDEIDGLSAVKPKGAMYVFPKIDSKKFNIKDDEKFVLDFLEEKHVLLVHGGAFNYSSKDHVRIVFLPNETDLTKAMLGMKEFLSTYRQK